MIKLRTDRESIFINPNHVVSIRDNGVGALVHTITGVEYKVIESPESIVKDMDEFNKRYWLE
jgi:hypothetical protein